MLVLVATDCLIFPEDWWSPVTFTVARSVVSTKTDCQQTWMRLLWSVDAWCASLRCTVIYFIFFSAALKPTLANAAGKTRAALSCSSLHIWVKWCCVHTAAVVVYKLLGSFWVFVTAEPTQRYHFLLLNAPWLVITCSKPPRRISDWNFAP